ncbi:MAG: LytR C-terminal domain-containing protein [Sphingomonas sp.]|uniref:LytR C-terminal domain-containing protein n=1 Tax=Sphingomonas sp. TaxID=28214 RepID=UPI003F81251D
MRPDLPLRVAIAGLLAATGGCMSSASRTALPEGTRFTADATASSVAASRLLADGNYGLAIEMYRRLLVTTPDDAAAIEGLALCYDRLQRYDLSDVYFQKALALAPRNESYYRAYAASLTAQGRTEEAGLLDVDRRAMLAAATAPAAPAQPAAVAVAAAPTPPTPQPPVVAAVAPVVPVVPPPPAPSGPRLEQIALGVVHLILPPASSPAGSSTVWVAIPPRAPATTPKVTPAPIATPSAPGALRNTMVINAVGRKGVAGRVQAYLAGRGWRPLDRGDSGMRILTSRILYPPQGETTARKLARAVPFATRLYAAPRANRIQLLVGANALRADSKLAGRRR